MKGRTFHMLVVIYYALFSLRIMWYSSEIVRDVKPLGDNIITILVQLCTMWVIVLQITYFALSLYDDMSQSNKAGFRKQSPLRQWITSYFIRHIVPASILVSVNFWTVYHINRSYIDEFNVLDSHITWWDNHGIHTVIVFLVFAELFTNYIPYPTQIWPEIKAFLKLIVGYLVTVAAVQPFSTIWVYPIFGLLTWYQWIPFFLVNFILASMAYVSGLVFNKVVWGDHPIEKKTFAATDTKNISKPSSKFGLWGDTVFEDYRLKKCLK